MLDSVYNQIMQNLSFCAMSLSIKFLSRRLCFYCNDFVIYSSMMNTELTPCVMCYNEHG